jgi:DNA topoisomerase-1
MKLVIVESPAKAKTINKYLGNDFKVIASFGHIRDLPSKNGSVIPEEDFMMKYEISAKSNKYVAEITKLAKSASEIYLATDPDREGEAISWHVTEVLKNKKIVKDDAIFKRIAFNEITKKAVLAAVAAPRAVDYNLVNAQQARRALDYLVGFTLSPILWRKLPGCKSAGRVQSVALRLICEREDEIERFISEEYWDVTLNMLSSKGDPFISRLTHIDGKKLEKFSLTSKKSADEVVSELKKKNFHISAIEKKQQRRNPPAPFITSSLQQEASRKLGFSAKKTMQIAQKLYEGIDLDGETVGLITYMRTDGVTLSTDAVSTIRQLIEKMYGKNYLPETPKMYKSKAKNAQEAHEAIRPTDINLSPEQLSHKLDKDQFKLYDLIWKRTIACQMENVIVDLVAANLDSEDNKFSARATGSTISFDGFYKIYKEGQDDTEEEKNKLLPPLEQGENITTEKVTSDQHFTEPAPRYSEASLVKRLEELGIGRPSTYASIISVLQDRKYAVMDKKRFFPTDLGRLVTSFLVGFFAKYVEYDFTAKLETDLDKVAEGEIAWKTLMQNFWQGFNENIETVSTRNITEVLEYVQGNLDFHLFGNKGTPEYKKNKKCPSCSDGEVDLRLGKYGAFLSCNNYPDCNFKRQISKNESDTSEGSQIDGLNDNTKNLGVDKNGEQIYLKKGPYGWYVQVGEKKDKEKKPKRSSIPSGITPDKVDLDIALNLLNLPLKIGDHPSTGEEITMGIGRFGPYLKYQGKFTSISKNIDPFSVDLDQAVQIIANKKVKPT